MRKFLASMLLAFTLLLVNDVLAQTAMFGTNPQHSGVYNSSFPSDVKLIKKWKFKTKGMIFSSAVVVNDIIYFGSDDSCLYAIDTTGTQKWKFKSNGIVRSTPAVKDTVAYFNNYEGMFYAINTNTGNELWHFTTDGEIHFSGVGLFGATPSNILYDDPWDFYISSPVINDTTIYFGSGRNVYAINASNGNQIWKYTTSDIIHSTPAVLNGIIYFGGWSGNLYALDALTGYEKWKYATGIDPSHLMQGIQSSPSIVDSMVVLVQGMHMFIC
jgi:outer membrane protein assembly factor BamB